jgi:hypothetical protein
MRIIDDSDLLRYLGQKRKTQSNYPLRVKRVLVEGLEYLKYSRLRVLI